MSRHSGSDKASVANEASTSKAHEPTTQTTQYSEGEQLYEIIEILAERGNRYKVNWAGEDPETKKPWPPSWVEKEQCDAPDLVKAWKARKRRQKRKATEPPEQKVDKGPPIKNKGKSVSQDRSAEPGDHREASHVENELPPALHPTHTSTTPPASPHADEATTSQQIKVGPPIGVKRKRKRATVLSSSADSNKPGTSAWSTRPPLYQAKRRKVAVSEELSTDSTSPAPANPVPEEVIPETQFAPPSQQDNKNTRRTSPSHIPGRDSGINEQETLLGDAVPRKRSVKTLAGKQELRPPRKSPLERMHDLTIRSNIQKSNLLRPLPTVAPSRAKNYLPTPDPIEEFSSPEKARKKRRNVNNTIESITPVASLQPGPVALAQQMEDEYVDFSGGAHENSQKSPARPARNYSPVIPDPDYLRPGPSNTAQSQTEEPSRIPFPPTASTQLASIDSQSQIIYAPDSQPATTALQEQLRIKEEIIDKLQEELALTAEDAESSRTMLEEQLSEMEKVVADLRSEIETFEESSILRLVEYKEESDKQQRKIDTLQTTLNLSIPVATYDEQTRVLLSTKAYAEELEASFANTRETKGQEFRNLLQGPISSLQAELRQQKGILDILSKRDSKTDDEVRRKAAEYPELCARIAELEATVKDAQRDIDSLHSIHAELHNQLASQMNENEALERTAQDTQLAHEAAREQLNELDHLRNELEALKVSSGLLIVEMEHLRGELASAAEVKVRLEQLLSSQETAPQTQTASLFVCRHATNGRPCHGLFTSVEAAHTHAITVHYPHLEVFTKQSQ